MSRLDILFAKMQAEKIKAAKPSKVKITKPVAPAVRDDVAPAVRDDSPVDISPLDTMNLIDDCVNKMTREEISNPANIIRLFNLFTFDELVRYRKRNFFTMISDRTLDSIIDLQKATNPKVARILTHS